MNELSAINEENIKNKIFTIRGMQVMLDKDLAELYEVETKVFNQAVKRNESRFPDDFRFQLTEAEYQNLRSQIVTSSKQNSLRSQSVTLKTRLKNTDMPSNFQNKRTAFSKQNISSDMPNYQEYQRG